MTGINTIVQEINEQLKGLGGVWNGMAVTLERDGKRLPVIKEKHIGVDDKHKLVAWHKLGNVATRRINNGYGAGLGDQVNSFSNSMVVFINNKLNPDEVFTVIQARLSDTLAVEPFRRVTLSVTGGNLDSEQVFQQEYTGGTYRLKPEQYLIRINYTVEAQFTKGCFSQCLTTKALN